MDFLYLSAVVCSLLFDVCPQCPLFLPALGVWLLWTLAAYMSGLASCGSAGVHSHKGSSLRSLGEEGPSLGLNRLLLAQRNHLL